MGRRPTCLSCSPAGVDKARAEEMMKEMSSKSGDVMLKIEKEIRPCVGLGSNIMVFASSCAAVMQQIAVLHVQRSVLGPSKDLAFKARVLPD